MTIIARKMRSSFDVRRRAGIIELSGLVCFTIGGFHVTTVTDAVGFAVAGVSLFAFGWMVQGDDRQRP
jgi:hypothetical protein